MEKPAIYGGAPVRSADKAISYGHQCIDEDDIKEVCKVLRSDYLTCGPHITEVEKKLCEITDAKYAVAVSNGTAALHIACMALDIKEGDEVITTPLTFAASANCALYCGATPVFADVDANTYNIDPASVEALITSKTKAVVAVDFTGQATKLDEIRAICNKHGIAIIEDAAHSIGTCYKGQPVGSIADLTTFSFHPVKTVTSGEGGAVTTNDERLYKRLLRLRSHGITRDKDEMIHDSQGPWYYEMVEEGYNYRMTDFQAALLSSQLNKLFAFKKRRSEIVSMYNEALAGIPEIIVQEEIPESDTCRHLYIIQLDLDKLKCSRREFFEAMAAENIHPQVHYLPVYLLPYYESLGYKKGLCPNAEKIYEGIMSIPLYPSLTDDDVRDVIRAINKLVDYYRK